MLHIKALALGVVPLAILVGLLWLGAIYDGVAVGIVGICALTACYCLGRALLILKDARP